MSCPDCSGITLLKGSDGRGITSITDNGDGTLTILYTDGNTYITPDFTGPTGIAGNAGIGNWKFSTTTTTPPASTTLRFNNASILSVTKIYIHKNDTNAVSKEDYLFSFYNESSTSFGAIYKYGIITVFELADINNYATFEITGISDLTTYMQYDVELYSQNSAFTNNMELGTIFTPSESFTRTKSIDINTWNMDSTNTVNIAHGISDYNKILEVDVLIKDDAGSVNTPLNTFYNDAVSGGVYTIDATNISLFRLTAGLFDSAAYNDSINRGYVLVKYLK